MSQDVLCSNRKPSETSDIEAIWVKSRRASNVSTGQGHWMLFYDNQLRVEGNLTAHDIAWFQICELVAKDMIFLAKCSTAKPNDLHPGIGYIYCYTESSSDENAVRQAAEEIRRATNYRYDMGYKLNEKTVIGWGSPQDFQLYKHTVKNEFLKFVCQWARTPKQEFESQLWNVPPSQVVDREFILIRSRKVFAQKIRNFEQKLLQEGGFFILIFNRNEHDTAWSKILNLIQEGVIVQAQCSTAKRDQSERIAYIHCYTEDYTDEEDVREVAEQIRRAIDYKHDMPYMLLTKGKLGTVLPQDFVLYMERINREFLTLKVDWIPVPRN